MDKDAFQVFGDRNKIQVFSSDSIGENVKVSIKGHDHTIIVDEGVMLRNMIINISGQGNTLHIGKHSNIRGSIHIRQSGSRVLIGEDFTSVGIQFFALEGKTIQIGNDCMFSSGIIIRTSDEHPILDMHTKERINPPKDVIVGNHVWVGEGTTLNKGAIIPDGCIVGARSFVSKQLSRPSASYAGSPARLVREGVEWKRKL